MQLRGEAIVVSIKGNLSNAAVLKKMKSDLDLKDLGGNVSKIRRTQKSNLMLELKKLYLGKMDGSRRQVKNSFRKDITALAQKHEVFMQCKNMTELILTASMPCVDS